MPELPEVETSRRGVKPFLEHQRVKALVVRNSNLRWPVTSALPGHIVDKEIQSVTRRAKYLQINFASGQLLIHLGMSGQLRIVAESAEVGKHDHIDLVLHSGKMLRFTDPRRFGFWLWSNQPRAKQLLANLGPEPLTEGFHPEHLYQHCKKRKTSIKQVIMDNKVVVGVGNIYAAESLFKSGIKPSRAANRISYARIERLTLCIKEVLRAAIEQGGTTLKDFTQSDGKPGYFAQRLMVYGRETEPCLVCGTQLKGIRQGQRATAYCPKCQT